MMTREILQILFLVNYHFVSSQGKEVIYLFTGQSSDSRVFDSLDIDPRFDLKAIEYDFPLEGMSLEALAKVLALQIDTCENYYFIGVSLGGMLCVELSEMMNPNYNLFRDIKLQAPELPLTS